MHDATKGRYAYLNDFASSLTSGPVKLGFGASAAPKRTAAQAAADEAAEGALVMIKRSLITGSIVAVGGCMIGWQIVKRMVGANDAAEFSQVMREKMPAVGESIRTSRLGQRLQMSKDKSHEAISESEELTGWRRSLRQKFNTPEGARLARSNSQDLARRRLANDEHTRIRPRRTETVSLALLRRFSSSTEKAMFAAVTAAEIAADEASAEGGVDAEEAIPVAAAAPVDGAAAEREAAVAEGESTGGAEMMRRDTGRLATPRPAAPP
jgi:hypothetical protein